jgi:hypothetical protein
LFFPETVHKEIAEKGKIKEIHQWDTFIRSITKVLNAVPSQGITGEEGTGSGGKRKREPDEENGNGSTSTHSGSIRTPGKIPLVLVLQESQALNKNIGVIFESLLRLSKMASPISSFLLFHNPDLPAHDKIVIRKPDGSSYDAHLDKSKTMG